jgi:hypothetical protein
LGGGSGGSGAGAVTVVVDNWPVHFRPDVLVALEEPETPFPLKTPAILAEKIKN